MGSFARFLSWSLQKAAVIAAILVLGTAAFGLWLFLRDRVDFDLRHIEIVRALTGETRRLEAALADVEARMAGMRSEEKTQEGRAAQAAKIAAELGGLHGVVDRFVGDAEQRRADLERIERLKRMRADAGARAAALAQSLVRAQWEKDGLETALGRTRRDLRVAEAGRSKVVHYAREAWARYGVHVLVVLGLCLFGPSLARLAGYYVFAPAVMRSRPVLLGAPGAPAPEVEASRASIDAGLATGDALWVKEKFLQASDEGLRRRTRFVLDWRVPLTCAACGLIELIEMRNDSAGDRRATFSSQEDPNTELALVTLPAGASLVLRPSFLAGAVVAAGARLRIRRHWRLFTWQSWLTGQFRHFEFVGPCRLLIAGGRGVRVEVLDAPAGGDMPARRTNRDATIGFTPGLAYRPVRAETAWSYLRGQNPLFDDLFEGRGMFLCQQTSARSDAAKERRFWAQVWSGLLRVFGV